MPERLSAKGPDSLRSLPAAAFFAPGNGKERGLIFRIGLVAAIALLVGVDQLTKYLATAFLAGQPAVGWQGVFVLQYSRNEGAAFGLFPGRVWILIGLTSLLVLGMLALLLSGRYRSSRMVNISGVLVVAGGLGNLIDRIWHGYVVDFLYFELIDFPIFNAADTFVVCGAVLLLVYFFFIQKDGEHTAQSMEVTDSGDDKADPRSGTDGPAAG